MGRIGTKELGRLAGGAEVPTSGRGWVRNIRQQLGSFASDLEGPALDRHRQLQEKLTPALMKHYGVTPQNKPGGPATAAGQTFVSPQAGTALRAIAEGSPLRRLAATGVLASGQDLSPSLYARVRRPEDGSLTNSIIRHELAEQRMMHSNAQGGYHANAFASHLGPAADMAERLGQRDPRAMEVLDRLRMQGKDDPRAAQLLRQHGMVGSYVPPLGGRAHRSLEQAIERMPVEEGATNRNLLGGRPTGQTRTVMDYVNRGARWLETSENPRRRELAAQVREGTQEILDRPFHFTTPGPNASIEEQRAHQVAMNKYVAHLSGLGPLPR